MRTITKAILFGATLGAPPFMAEDAKADPMTRDGFYLHLDAGLGYYRTSSDSDILDESISGLTIPSSLLLGGTVGPVVIGGGLLWHYVPVPSLEAGGTNIDTSGLDVSLSMLAVGIFADIYPDPKSGLHFLPMVGYGIESVTVEGRDSANDPAGLLLSFGAGYEFWVANEWSIGPMLRFDYGLYGYHVDPPIDQDISYPAMAISALATFTLH